MDPLDHVLAVSSHLKQRHTKSTRRRESMESLSFALSKKLSFPKSHSFCNLKTELSRPHTVSLVDSFSSKYDLVDQLGVGGYGYIYSALRKQDQKMFAVKFIDRLKIPANKWAMDRELGLVPVEVFCLKNISHSGVVGFEEMLETEHFFILVQELFGSVWKQSAVETSQGKPPALAKKVTQKRCMDLYELLDSQVLEEDALKSIFRQVVQIVRFLFQEHGIVHGDLKDENILVNSDFRVKLIDFGGAIRINLGDPVVSIKQFNGTVEFAAPEVLNSQRYDAERAEVWSLGVLLHSMLFGTLPFLSLEHTVRFRFRDSGNYKQHKQFPAMDLIARCLEKDPLDRPQLDEILSHQWLLLSD